MVKLGHVHSHSRRHAQHRSRCSHDTLTAMLSGAVNGSAHIEVETHNLMVPGRAKGPGALVSLLAEELDWARTNLSSLGLQLAA